MPPTSETNTPSPPLCCTQISEPSRAVTFHDGSGEIQTRASGLLARPRVAIGVALNRMDRFVRLL
jgi:hypothetical protein